MKKYWEMWLVTITNCICGEQQRRERPLVQAPSEARWNKSAQQEFRTYQLDGGEVLLPPQVLLVVWAHGSQTVVRVHDDMDHTVEKGMECSHTTWNLKSVRYNSGLNFNYLIKTLIILLEIWIEKKYIYTKTHQLQTELRTTRWTAWWSDGTHAETSPGCSFSWARRRPEKDTNYLDGLWSRL